MVDVKNAGAAFGCSSVSLPSDRLGRYLHLVLFENSQDLFGPNFPELADLDDACLALFRDTLGGCRELDDEHFQAIEDLQRRSEEHTSELQSLMRISYAVFCLKNKNSLSVTHILTIAFYQHKQLLHIHIRVAKTHHTRQKHPL